MSVTKMSKELSFLINCFPNLPEQTSKGMEHYASRLFESAIVEAIERLDPKLRKIFKQEVEETLQEHFRLYLQENKAEIVDKLIQKKMKELLK